MKISNTHHKTRSGIIKRNPTSNRIKLVRKETETYYDIRSNNTIYAQFKKAKFYDKDVSMLVKKRKDLIKTLRNNGVKVSHKRNDDLIITLITPFKHDIQDHINIEREVIEKFDKIYKKGLYPPTIDNKELDEATKLMWKLNPLKYRDQPISIINEIYSDVEDLSRNMDKNYIKVVI